MKDILHNIPIVYITMDYPKEFVQELVSIQLDLVKACHKVPHWVFIRKLMKAMVLELVDTSEDLSISYIFLNGGVTKPFSLWESTRQRFALSPYNSSYSNKVRSTEFNITLGFRTIESQST